MLALLVALSLSQVTPDSRVTRVERVPGGRMEGGRGGVKAWAFFEAFPVGGAGVGSVAPYPNWLTYSEQYDNAAWTKDFASAGGVLTANAATAPDGTLTAERLQCNAGAWNCRLYQASVPGVVGAYIRQGFWVKGNGTSGTIYESNLGLGGTTACSYTSTDWSFCSATATSVTSTGSIFGFVGCEAGLYGMPATCPSLDVFIWGHRLNFYDATQYVQTTSAYATRMPTGAKGETLTFSRTGTAMATRTATGGLATSGIANGDLVLMPANAPRVEYDSAGTLGLLVESARTNSALRSQELDNAAWTSFATGVASPTITADNAVAPDGTTTAERFQIPAVTTAQNSIRYQSPVTTNTVVSTCSVYVKGNATSETTDICIQTATGYTCSACAFVSSSWSRCVVTATAGGALQCFVGNAGSLNGTPTARNAVDFFAWGFQAEAGAYATSYIPTTSAAVTRNAEVAYFAGPAITSTISEASSVTLEGAPASTAYWLSSDTGGADFFVLGTFGNLYSQTGGGFTQNAGTPTVGPVHRVNVSWDGTNRSTCLNGSCTTAAITTSWARPATRLSVGSILAGGGGIDALFSRICVDPSPTRCR